MSSKRDEYERTTCLVCDRHVDPAMQHPVLVTIDHLVEVWICWYCIERYVIIHSMSRRTWAAYKWRAIEPYVSLPRPFGLGSSGPATGESSSGTAGRPR